MANFCKFCFLLIVFRSLKIPYLCLLESKKTLLRVVGKEYFYVEPECGILEPEKQSTWAILEDKNHGNVQRAASRDDKLYQFVKDFIG